VASQKSPDPAVLANSISTAGELQAKITYTGGFIRERLQMAKLQSRLSTVCS
jgi:hypothetical protein